jgi:hypothetical protein
MSLASTVCHPGVNVTTPSAQAQPNTSLGQPVNLEEIVEVDADDFERSLKTRGVKAFPANTAYIQSYQHTDTSRPLRLALVWSVRSPTAIGPSGDWVPRRVCFSFTQPDFPPSGRHRIPICNTSHIVPHSICASCHTNCLWPVLLDSISSISFYRIQPRLSTSDSPWPKKENENDWTLLLSGCLSRSDSGYMTTSSGGHLRGKEPVSGHAHYAWGLWAMGTSDQNLVPIGPS